MILLQDHPSCCNDYINCSIRSNSRQSLHFTTPVIDMSQWGDNTPSDGESLEASSKPDPSTAKSAYDEVLVLLGDFGFYHIRSFLLLIAMNIYTGFPSCVIILLFLDVPFRCSVPGLPNDTFHIQDESHQRLVNASIPSDVTTGQYSECSAYVSDAGPNVTAPCKRWVYDNAYAASSFVSHLDLVCDRRYIKSQFITALSIGLVIGVVGSGPVADVFGRKRPMIIFLLISSASIFTLASITYIPLMVVLCCVLGAVVLAAFVISFTLIFEIIGPSKRPLAGLGIQLGWSLGLLLGAPFVYLIYDYQISSYAIAAMGCAFVAYFWLLDESPRWLLTQNKMDEALEIFRRMAKVNKVKLNDLDDQIMSLVKNETAANGSSGLGFLIKDLKALAKSRVLLFRVFALSFIWFSLLLAYSGMLYNIGDMIAGDVYSNFAIMAAMEFLGYLCCFVFTRWFARRTLHFSFTLVSTVSFFISALSVLLAIGQSWIPILTFATAKFSVTGALFIIYIIANELMPTVVRTTSVGVCCCVGQIGCIAATQMIQLPVLIPTTFGKTLPLFLFGAFLLVSTLLTLVLPETKNRKLPDTIQEAKDLGREKLKEKEKK